MTPRKGTGGISPGRPKSPRPLGIGINLEPEVPQDTGQSDHSRLEALRALLEGILNDPETSPRDISAVSREYRQCITALGQLAPAPAGTRLDEIAARRRKRGTS